jgi:uncharacterized protein (TIGR02117 family)
MAARWLRLLALALALPPLAALLYVGAACALMFWPARSTMTAGQPTVQAWVLSNGIHTDLVFPIAGHGVDWRQVFPPGDMRAAPPDSEFIAIGWGDREFYLHTPTWADLTAQRAASAVLGRNRALLHVTYLRRADLARGAHRLPLSQPQYDALRHWVLAALPQGRAVPVAGAHYAVNDAFYEAHGRYHLFDTCNTWTGRALRQAGVPVSRWTPFDFNVTWHLQPGQP